MIGQVGSWVRIQGLQGAPQLNGLEAKVQSYDEATHLCVGIVRQGSMRYVVELRDGTNKSHGIAPLMSAFRKIKEANLVPHAESKSWWLGCQHRASGSAAQVATAKRDDGDRMGPATQFGRPSEVEIDIDL